jgi:pimeloyl-ACP methyl ester carboxylesterase
MLRLAMVALTLAALAVSPSAALADERGAPVPKLRWGPCPAATPEEAELLEDYQCTTARVPLSYREPRGRTIELALGRLPAANPRRRIGSLFWNPGGPGGSGRIPPAFSEALHERFDIVGFDPRGIADSTQLRCFDSNEEAFALLGWEFPITREQEREVIELSQQATRRCAENGGPILAHMATGNVARDLDLLRRAVGDRQLTYLGFSYGTHIGTVYANLFPDKVRALTLDAVIDPVEWTTGRTPAERLVPVEFRAGSFYGSYDALLTFLAACAGDARCAFREPGRDLLAKYDTLLDRLRERPLVTTDPGGNPVTVTYQTAVGMTLGALYDPAASTDLGIALQELYLATEARLRGAAYRLRHRLPPKLLLPAHEAADGQDARIVGLRQPEEPYFGIEATAAVECTDSDNPRNPFVWPFWARLADREAPYFGSLWLYFALPCATWPARDRDRYTGPWDRRTANPVLLIGNSLGDPATPYEDAVSTARLMANARLLTLNSFGHAAFGQSQCVVTTVERYMIEKRLPPPGTVCQPDRGPFDPPPEQEPLLKEALAPETIPVG